MCVLCEITSTAPYNRIVLQFVTFAAAKTKFSSIGDRLPAQIFRYIHGFIYSPVSNEGIPCDGLARVQQQHHASIKPSTIVRVCVCVWAQKGEKEVIDKRASRDDTGGISKKKKGKKRLVKNEV